MTPSTEGTASAESTQAPHRGFRRLARHSAGYAVGALVGKFVGILVVPVLTRTLSTQDFGRFEVLSTLQSAVASILLLGLDTASTRLFPDLTARHRRAMFLTWALLLAVLTLPWVLGLAAGGVSISRALFGTSDYSIAVALVGLAIAASVYQQLGLTVLRNHEQPGRYALSSSLGFLVYGLLVITLVIVDPTVTSVVIALTAGLATGAVMALLFGRKGIGGRPERGLGRMLLRLGLPLVPAIAAAWVEEFANRTILLVVSGAVEVAYFSLAFRFASVAVLVLLAFQTAWQVQAFSSIQDAGGLWKIAQDGRRIVVSVAATTVAIAGFGPELIRIIAGDEYLPALPALTGSLGFAIAFALFHVITMPSALSKHMKDLGISAAVGAIMGIALTALLARPLGSGGTALAFLLGQLIAVALGSTLARRRTPVPFEWGRMTVVVAAAGATIAISLLPPGGAPLLLRLGLVAAFVAVLFIEGTALEVIRSLRGSRSPESAA